MPKRKGDQNPYMVRKVKKEDDDDEVSRKILSKYDKINEELNKAVATYLVGEGDVKDEVEHESDKFSKLIRSKLGDLDEDDSDNEREKEVISPDRYGGTENQFTKMKDF